MKINGMEAKYIGEATHYFPWTVDEGYTSDAVWETEDGEKYVERYVQGDMVKYSPEFGKIWTEEEWEKASKEHAKLEDLPVYDPNEYKGPFTVWEYEDYEETETQINAIFDAICAAETCIENGGLSNVIDTDGNDIPLFATWKQPNTSSMADETLADELPF